MPASATSPDHQPRILESRSQHEASSMIASRPLPISTPATSDHNVLSQPGSSSSLPPMPAGVAPSQLVLSGTEQALPGDVTSLLPPIEFLEKQPRIQQQEPRSPDVRFPHIETSPGMDSEAIFDSFIDTDNFAQRSLTRSPSSLTTPLRGRTTHRNVADAINHAWASPSQDIRAAFPSPSFNHRRQISPFRSPRAPGLMDIDEQPSVQTQHGVNGAYVVHLYNIDPLIFVLRQISASSKIRAHHKWR